MNIKTITCHEVYNAGASLQEYALLEYLRKIGYQAEAIHYKPAYLSQHFKLTAVSNPKYDKPFIKILYLFAKLPERIVSIRKKINYDCFHKKYIPTYPKTYYNNEELKKKFLKQMFLYVEAIKYGIHILKMAKILPFI